MVVEEPFVLETAELAREGGAVHGQVVGQLLPIQGDLKAHGTRQMRLVGEVGQDLVAQTALLDLLDRVDQSDGLVGQGRHHVGLYPLIQRGALVCVAREGRRAQREQLGVLRGVHGQGIDIRITKGVRRPKEPVALDGREEGAIAPIVVGDDRERAGQHHVDMGHGVACRDEDLVLGELEGARLPQIEGALAVLGV